MEYNKMKKAELIQLLHERDLDTDSVKVSSLQETIKNLQIRNEGLFADLEGTCENLAKTREELNETKANYENLKKVSQQAITDTQKEFAVKTRDLLDSIKHRDSRIRNLQITAITIGVIAFVAIVCMLFNI